MMDVASGMDYVFNEDMFKEISRKLYANVDAVTMQQQQPGANGQSANGQSVIAGVFNGVINEAIVVNGKMADFAEAFKQQQQQQLSPQQQPSPPQAEAAGVIVEAATATAVYLQDQFQAETDAATAALVVGTADADTMTVESFDGQQVVTQQQMEEDEASAGPGQAQAGEGEVDPNAPDTWFMTDESLEWTDSKIASYNPKQKLFRCIDCECCGFLARVAEHWLGTHANLRVFQCPHCPYASAWARCVRMHLARQHNASEQNALWTENPVLGEVTKYLSRLRARVEAGPLVIVNEDELVEDEQQQLELEQHEQQLQEQQLREQQLLEQQLHEQQLREQQLHEQQLQQQLQQQAAAAASLVVSTGSPTQTEYALVTTAGESVVISASALTQGVQQAQALAQAQTVLATAAAQTSTQPGTQPARSRNRTSKGPRRVNKAIAVAAAVAAATARGDNVEQAAAAGAAAKRYNCTSCPYQTDRRDLYTRHEAIHLAEKPFHCYACQKQFNRADHVKKHFLRMHRDQPYDLNRIRRHASSKASAASSPTATTASTATSTVTTASPTGNGGSHAGAALAFYNKFTSATGTTTLVPLVDEDVNGVATTSQQQQDDQELQQELELQQQLELEQQQLQQHELQLQQQELQQLQQQQIILQTQPLHHQQSPQQQQPQASPQQQQAQPGATINIPNMANYTLSSRLLSASNGHVLKTAPAHAPGMQQQQQTVVLQMASVITDSACSASKVAAGGGGGGGGDSNGGGGAGGGGGVVVVPEVVVQVGSGGVQGVQVDDVPRTKGGREKRYPCPYCTWSGVDNWCLKRHLNTHLKPFVCALCDYKAARTERLQTHVLKVHNKRTCIRCTYMADDQNQLNAHLQEHHGQLPSDLAPQPPRQKRGPGRKVGAGGQWAGPQPGTLPGPMYQAGGPGPHEVMNHIRRPPKRWRPRPHGADRLFNYLEASDSEDELELLPEDLVCQQCGLEFLDTESLQTHLMSMHRMTLAPSQGPAPRPYHCTICGYSSPSHPDIVEHMQKHAVIEMRCCEPGCRFSSSVPGAMEEHARLAHPPMPPLNQKCPHCGFVVLSATALVRHAKTHHLATVACTACNRVHGRFERHRNGEMWSEEEQEDDEELMAAAAQAAEDAVNAIEDDGDPDEDGDGPSGDVGASAASPKTPSDHELALQALRRHWRIRRRRMRRFHALRKELQAAMTPPQRDAAEDTVEDAVEEALPSFPGVPEVVARLRVKHVGRWLVRRRLGCFVCPPGRRHPWNVHSMASLAAHREWRHRPDASAFSCDSCSARFRHRYQALLHASRDHADSAVDADVGADAEAEPAQQHGSIAEPIVTLTVPQYMATASTATTTTAPGHQQHLQVELQSAQHLQLQQPHDQQTFAQMEALQVQQVYQVQAAADGATGTVPDGYDMDNVTVVPAVLYTCAPQQQTAQQPQPADQQADADPQQQEQFQGPIYNGMMVPSVPTVPAMPAKQVWYPQIATPSYYISTQFPST